MNLIQGDSDLVGQSYTATPVPATEPLYVTDPDADPCSSTKLCKDSKFEEDLMDCINDAEFCENPPCESGDCVDTCVIAFDTCHQDAKAAKDYYFNYVCQPLIDNCASGAEGAEGSKGKSGKTGPDDCPKSKLDCDHDGICECNAKTSECFVPRCYDEPPGKAKCEKKLEKGNILGDLIEAGSQGNVQQKFFQIYGINKGDLTVSCMKATGEKVITGCIKSNNQKAWDKSAAEVRNAGKKLRFAVSKVWFQKQKHVKCDPPENNDKTQCKCGKSLNLNYACESMDGVFNVACAPESIYQKFVVEQEHALFSKVDNTECDDKGQVCLVVKKTCEGENKKHSVDDYDGLSKVECRDPAPKPAIDAELVKDAWCKDKSKVCFRWVEGPGKPDPGKDDPNEDENNFKCECGKLPPNEDCMVLGNEYFEQAKCSVTKPKGGFEVKGVSCTGANEKCYKWPYGTTIIEN